MAGDIDIGEVLILGEPPGGLPPFPVVHEYGPRVRIGLTLTREDTETIRYGVINPENFTFSERMGHDAFLLRQSPTYLEEKRTRLRSRESWTINPPRIIHPVRGGGSPPGR